MLDGHECMQLPVPSVQQQFTRKKNLEVLIEVGFICVEIGSGMDRLSQAGKLAHDILVLHLTQHGYELAKYTIL